MNKKFKSYTKLFACIFLAVLFASCEKIDDFEHDIHIAGNYYDNDFNPRACYWKNGEMIPLLTNHDIYTKPVVIAEAEGDIYIASNYSPFHGEKICYWKNGVMTDTLTDGFPFAIALAGDDIYIAGNFRDGGIKRACYWKNGKKTELPTDGSALSRATSIAVVVK